MNQKKLEKLEKELEQLIAELEEDERHILELVDECILLQIDRPENLSLHKVVKAATKLKIKLDSKLVKNSVAEDAFNRIRREA